jgi:hypothetical protein
MRVSTHVRTHKHVNAHVHAHACAQKGWKEISTQGFHPVIPRLKISCKCYTMLFSRFKSVRMISSIFRALSEIQKLYRNKIITVMSE